MGSITRFTTNKGKGMPWTRPDGFLEMFVLKKKKSHRFCGDALKS
jgi:hypothetical protein